MPLRPPTVANATPPPNPISNSRLAGSCSLTDLREAIGALLILLFVLQFSFLLQVVLGFFLLLLVAFILLAAVTHDSFSFPARNGLGWLRRSIQARPHP